MNEPAAAVQPAALATAAAGETLAGFLDRLLASDLPLERIVAAAKALSDPQGIQSRRTATEVFDIFFFATEVNFHIEDEEMLRQDVDRNPVPYMLVLTGSRFPVTFNKKE